MIHPTCLQRISHSNNRSCPPTGAAIGPALGGFLAEGYGFQAPFYFVASAVMLVAINNYTRLSETHPNHNRLRSKDVTSLADDVWTSLGKWKVLLKSSGGS